MRRLTSSGAASPLASVSITRQYGVYFGIRAKTAACNFGFTTQIPSQALTFVYCAGCSRDGRSMHGSGILNMTVRQKKNNNKWKNMEVSVKFNNGWLVQLTFYWIVPEPRRTSLNALFTTQITYICCWTTSSPSSSSSSTHRYANPTCLCWA